MDGTTCFTLSWTTRSADNVQPIATAHSHIASVHHHYAHVARDGFALPTRHLVLFELSLADCFYRRQIPPPLHSEHSLFVAFSASPGVAILRSRLTPSPPVSPSLVMLASYILSLSLLFSLLVYPTIAQSTLTFGFCFTDSSKPGSPYGPWSVATWGTLVVNATGYVTTVSTSGGGGRYGYTVVSANAQRMQKNRDGTTSTATLGLCPVGLQGSDNVLYNNSNPTSQHAARTHHAAQAAAASVDSSAHHSPARISLAVPCC